MTDIKKLKALAEVATAGPWEHRFIDGEGSPGAICHEHGWVADDFSEQAFKDTAYMATANPAAVLELIADYESAMKHWENESRNVEVLAGELAGAQAMLETAQSERDQLKTENEALRVLLDRAWYSDGNICTSSEWRDQYRAAMSKEASHE